MPKFRKKPVVIDAVQWHIGDNLDGVYYDKNFDVWYIKTLEGKHIVTDGSWIITGMAGEKYSCRPHIFEATYEAV